MTKLYPETKLHKYINNITQSVS